MVLVALGALAYFGVLNPEKMMPNKTTEENETIEYEEVTVLDEPQAVTVQQIEEVTVEEIEEAVEQQDLGQYDYCVEWDSWIQLENMVYNCYNFERQEINCGWEVLEDNKLLVVSTDGTQKTYNCTRYVKSIRIE